MLVTLRDLAVATAALVTAVMVLAKFPPVRWAWRTWIAKPLTEWAHDTIASAPAVREMHHELHRNDGSSIKDAVERLEDGNARIEQRLELGDGRFDQLAADIVETTGRLTRIEEAVTSPPPG